MPVSIRLSDQKVFSQLKNGPLFDQDTSDFTNYVKANVLEKVRIESEVIVGWWADAGGGNWVRDIVDNLRGFIKVPGLNWNNEGFSVGDFITCFSSGSTGNFSGTVESIEGDQIYIANTIAQPASGVLSDDAEVFSFSYLPALDFGYKLVATGESFNITSRFTQTEQRFFVVDIPEFSTSSGQPFDPTNQGWVAGNLQVTDLGQVQNDSVTRPATTYRKYRITQDIIITPFYIDGELNNLRNLLAPNRFKGENTLDYQFRATFKDSVQNPNSEKEFELSSWNSNIGYFNENVNGFPNYYEIESLDYGLSVLGDSDRLEVGKENLVSVRINALNNTVRSNVRVTIGIVRLLETADYQQSTEDWPTTWLFDSVTARQSDGLVDGDIIKEVQVISIFTSWANVSCKIDLTNIEGIDPDDDYILFAQIQDQNLSNDNSDKVCLLADVNQFFVDTDVEGLFELDYVRGYDGRALFDPNVLAGNTSIKCFNESELMFDTVFRLQREKNPVITRALFVLGGYNSSEDEYFSIQEYSIPLDFVTVDGIQEINLETTRGYNLADTNQFNKVVFEKIGDSATEVAYRSQIGLKINWQEWLQLNGVPTQFRDTALPFDGFNQKTSNYSLSNGYEIRVWWLITARAEGVDTDYRLLSNRIEVTDYETEHVGNSVWNGCTIETFSEDGLTSFGQTIQNNQNTLIKATFDAVDNITDPSLYWGALRLEREQQAGFDQDILHSLFSPIASSPIQPLAGETSLNLSVEGGNLVLSGLVDYTKLAPNTTYSPSAEADQKEPSSVSGAYSIGYNKNAYN